MIEIPEHVPPMHHYLVRQATERIETAYLNAIKQEIHNPAVFVMDQSSELAQVITGSVDRKAEEKRFIKRAQQNDGIPVSLWHLPADVAAGTLPGGLDDLAAFLLSWNSSSNPECFPVIVVDHEGVTVLPFPVPAC